MAKHSTKPPPTVHGTLGNTEEWEQGVIAMVLSFHPPAVCGHPTPSYQLFYQAVPLVMGTSGTPPAGACNTGCSVTPSSPPPPASPPVSFSVSLLSATVKQLDHLPARIDFCFPISKLDGRKRLKTVCQFEVE